MKPIATAIVIGLCATQASALSCMFGDGATAYHQAAGNGANFVAAIGQLTWLGGDDARVHNGGLIMQFEGQTFDVTARFVGEIITGDATPLAIDKTVQVQSHCINGDCGYAYDGADMLTFLHATDTGLVMFAYPCQSYPFTPNTQSIQDVTACVKGESCGPEWDRG